MARNTNLSFFERVGLFYRFGLVYGLSLWTLIKKPFSSTDSRKTWRRVLFESSARLAFSLLSMREMKALREPTQVQYDRWVKANGSSSITEELAHGGKLHWIGKKRHDRVILFIHGGAFLYPVNISVIGLIHHIQTRLAEEIRSGVAIAILNYSLAPESNFPCPLKQANAAIAHLFESGVEPENLQVIGDSAGGNLIVQVFTHALHPIPDPSIPPSPLIPLLTGKKKPLRGAYLCSPWLNVAGTGGSFAENGSKDIASDVVFAHLGEVVLAPIPSSFHVYLEPRLAPSTWFAGISKLVDRFLITAGGNECLRDDIVDFANNTLRVGGRHEEVLLVVQDGWGHSEEFFGFDGDEGRDGDMTGTVVQWLKDGYSV